MVAELAPLLGRDPDPALPLVVPADVLLLPQSLLPRFLGGSAGMRGRRATQELLGRKSLAFAVAKRPSLCALLCPAVHRHPFLGCALGLSLAYQSGWRVIA